MNERMTMMRRLSAEQFAAWELHIFLDTHPHDRQAFEMYQKHMKKAKELKMQFEQKFGPISEPNDFDGGHWNWNNAPWPWESEKEGK